MNQTTSDVSWSFSNGQTLKARLFCLSSWAGKVGPFQGRLGAAPCSSPWSVRDGCVLDVLLCGGGHGESSGYGQEGQYKPPQAGGSVRAL